jgi:hypothetical protein
MTRSERAAGTADCARFAVRLARAFARCRRHPPQIAVEIGPVDLDELAAFECIDAGLDLSAQRLELERIFPAALLQGAQRVAAASLAFMP